MCVCAVPVHLPSYPGVVLGLGSGVRRPARGPVPAVRAQRLQAHEAAALARHHTSRLAHRVSCHHYLLNIRLNSTR